MIAAPLGRMLKLCVMIAALVAHAAISPARAEPKFDEVVGEVSDWTVGYSASLAGCSAYTTYEDDTILQLGYSKHFEFFLALSNKSWKSLVKGEKYKISLRAQGYGTWTGDFTAFERGEEKGLIVTGLKDAFLNDIARAGGTTVSAGSRRITSLSLDGSRAALGAVIDCQKARNNRASADASNAPKPKDGGGKGQIASGTGFYVSDQGHILTNHHVIDGCRKVDVVRKGNVMFPARIVASDPRNDLALLKIESAGDPVPPIRANVKLGEPIHVFGFPLSSILASSGNFTSGNITALAGISDDSSRLQLSAPVQPGNSGGPLIDRYGNVVGVIYARAARAEIQNANFAVKAAVAKLFLELNGVKPDKAEKTETKEATDIAELAISFTVFIRCEMN